MFSDNRHSRIDYCDTLGLEDLLAAERESPRDVYLLVSIGRHYLKQRMFAQSHAYYSKALAIDKDDGWTHLYMGNLCYALACYEEAESHFKRAIELLPAVACPHWCLADVYNRQGYWLRSETEYLRAVETDPSDMKAKERLEAWLANTHSRHHNTRTPNSPE